MTKENKFSHRNLRAPKLISWGESKILELSNKYIDGNTITESQEGVRSALHSILLNEEIIDFDTKGNAPRFWGLFGDGLKDRFKDTNYCSLADANNYFNSFDPIVHDNEEREDIEDSEIQTIELLECAAYDIKNDNENIIISTYFNSKLQGCTWQNLFSKLQGCTW